MRPYGRKKRHARLRSIAFHNDHDRDLDLRQLGFTVLRYSDRQLEDAPERTAADVAAALAR